MITENLSTLKIHKLTQAQYDRELAAGRIDQNALYLTPDEQTSEQFGDVVRYDANQYLTEAQKAQARYNIGAVEINDIKDYVDEKIASTGGDGAPDNFDWGDIVDRPFRVLSDLVAELSGTFDSNAANAMVPDASAKTLIVGNTYSVLWNGTEYTTECVIADGVPAIGNVDLMSGTGDNGAPFVIGRDLEGTVVGTPCWVVASTIGAVSEAYTAVVTFKRECLDNKCLSILDYTPPVVTEILPATQFEDFYRSSDFGVYVQDGPASYTLVIGNEYNVTWDGDTHRCVAQDISAILPGAVGLGNVAALAPGYAGNNERFIIAYIADVGATYASLTDAVAGGSHTVGITQTTAEVTKIKPEYLPVAVTSADNGKILEVVNGAWATVTIAESSIKTYIDGYIASALGGDY